MGTTREMKLANESESADRRVQQKNIAQREKRERGILRILLLNRITTVEVCDARDDDSSNAAG